MAETEGRNFFCRNGQQQQAATDPFRSFQNVIALHLSRTFYDSYPGVVAFSCFKYVRDDGEAILLPMHIPRTGIILIRNEFFIDHEESPNPDTNSMVNSLIRLGSLFHEARHSDGDRFNFLHVPCNENDLFPFDCDDTVNGSKGVEFLFYSYAANICGDDYCSEQDREFLLAFGRSMLANYIVDSHYRDATQVSGIPSRFFLDSPPLSRF